MNLYTYIITAALLLNFILEFIASRLNVNNLEKVPPDEFSDTYSSGNYARSQEYLRERTNFGLLSGAFALLVLFAFWHSGGFNIIDIYLKQNLDSMIWRGLGFIGLLSAGQALISLPFSIYSTFVIEEKYGFNNTTPGIFIGDLFKSIVLSILIGGPILALLLYLLDSAGAYAWLYGWALVTAISFAIQYVAPTWIMPLFNKFTPLDEGELRNKIFEFAEKVNFPLKNIYIIDGSRRSSKSNAFFTGFGSNKRIALYDTLLENHTNEEIVAILAHEIGHYKKRHITKSMVLGIIHTGVLFWLLSLFLHSEGLYKAFFMEYTPIYAGLVFFALLYSPAESLLSIILNKISRKNEFEADEFAAVNLGTPEGLINALKKLSANNFSNLTPHPFYVFMNYSHPPVLNRIKALRKINY